MKASVRAAEARHRLFRDDLVAVLRKYSNELSAQEMLALAAHLVGQIVAMQDQRTVTPEMAMQIVSRNIEQGNREVLDNLLDAKSGSA